MLEGFCYVTTTLTRSGQAVGRLENKASPRRAELHPQIELLASSYNIYFFFEVLALLYTMGACDVCAKSFTSSSKLRKHKRATGHCVCQKCNKALATSEGLVQHRRDAHSLKCPQCHVKLVDKQSLANHQRKANHCYCGDCNRAFNSPAALSNHLQGSNHSTEFRCCDCDRSFINSGALQQHLRGNSHERKITAYRCQQCDRRYKSPTALQQHAKVHQVTTGTRCQKCSREFKDPNALEQHMNSVIHRPFGDIGCIAGVSCGRRFSSPSALILHLESGACSSGMNRAALNEIIIAHDGDRVITRSGASLHNMLAEVNKRLEANAGSGGSLANNVSVAMDPTPTSRTVSSFVATPNSLTSPCGLLSDWATAVSRTTNNQCPFCPPTRRPFRGKTALEDHLRSAAHSETIFFCPKSLIEQQSTKHQERKFRTASGLAQHLESGACFEGRAGFSRMLRYLQMHVRRLGLTLGLATLVGS